jgi:hypothetical protein
MQVPSKNDASCPLPEEKNMRLWCVQHVVDPANALLNSCTGLANSQLIKMVSPFIVER